MLWSKVKSPSVITGDSSSSSSSRSIKDDEHVNNVKMIKKLNVKDEYMEALRTKSYTDIWSKVQGQLRRTILTKDKLSSNLSKIPSYTHISDYLLEPNQETLIKMTQTYNLHYLIIDYFEASLQACRICGLLLRCIDQARTNYCIIQRVIKLAKKVSSSDKFSDGHDEQMDTERFGLILGELATFAKLENPLSKSNDLQFDIVHDRYGLMLNQLKMKGKRIERKVKVISLCKKTWEASMVLACGGLAIATVVLAIHSLVGLVALPGLVTLELGFLKKKIRSTKNGAKRSKLMRVYGQLDAAAKGVYTLSRDFDTMSRLVMRLHDEIDHGKSIAEMCLKMKKKQVLKEVVKEFQTQESCFLEKLGELEEHVYLCVLTINRARRLVIKEIKATNSPQHMNKI